MMKIYKYILTISLIFFSILGTTTTIHANDVKIVDNAHILDTQQEKALTEQINRVISKYQCDIVIVTVNSTNDKKINAYADDYFDENNYGIGSNRDGILLLLNYQESELAISTSGYGITAFTDYGIDYIFDELIDTIQTQGYYQGFEKFVSLTDQFLKQAKNNTPIDSIKGQVETEPKNYALAISIGVFGGSIVAFVVTQSMKSKLKSVKPVNNAYQYLDQNGLVLTNTQDIFLYKTLTKTAIPKETSHSTGQSHHTQSRSGGSTTHTSSSGRTHGGGSRKF